MRALPVGLLLLVPSLVAAQPASDWQEASASKAVVTSQPLPPPTTPPPLRAATEPAAPAPFMPAPVTATKALPPPPLAGSLADVQTAPRPKDYGPQHVTFGSGVTAAFDVTYQTLKGFRP